MPAITLRRSFSALGTIARAGLADAWDSLRLAGDALAAALSPSTYTPRLRAAAARQLCLAAWRVLPGVALVCALLSYVVIRIVAGTARDFGLSEFALDIFARVLVLELIPLFVALFVALRSGAAIGTEIALLRSGAVPGGEPRRADLLARGMGNGIAVLVLTAAGCAVALAVAYVGQYGLSPWGHAAFSRALGQVLHPLVLAGLALKVALFAVAVAVIPVAAILGAPRSPRSVPEAAPRGLVRLFVGLALVEAVWLAAEYV